MQNIKKDASSLALWLEQINLWPGSFLIIILLIFLMIPFSLMLLVLLPYFIQSINSAPIHLGWGHFLGNQLAAWLTPIFSGTSFERGISIEFQKEWFVYILIFVSFLYAILNYTSDSMLRNYGEKIAKKYRHDIAQKYLSLNYKSASTIEAGLLSSMVGEDMREAQQSFTRLISSLIKDGLASLIFIIWLVILDYRLFILFLTILIPAAIVLRITAKTLKKHSKQGLQFESELLSGLLERMRGWQTIQIFKAISVEISNFNKINDKIYHVWRRATRARALGTPLVEWLGIIAGSFIIITALKRISDGLLSSQILTAFMVTVGFLSDKINRITNQLNTTRKGTDALHRIKNFLNTNFEQRSLNSLKEINFNQSSELERENITPSLFESNQKNILSFEFKNISIANDPGKILLKNINIKFYMNSIIVIIGPSGIGKSTFIRTLLGVQPPNSGSIYINDEEINEDKFEEFSKLIGFIPQEPFLFTGTILENIFYPKKIVKPTQYDLNQAQSALNDALLNKNLFESIHGLSGGEKQRLMFARIFFHKPKLIIIDEGTSAIDLNNELKLMENLKKHSQNSIIFMVAHRPAIKNYATHILDLSQYNSDNYSPNYDDGIKLD